MQDPLSCNQPCAGDGNQKCGAAGRINVYTSGVNPGPPPAPPAVLATYGNWTTLGCYSDNGAGRTLTAIPAFTGPLTVEKCADACAVGKYRYSGVEYGVVSPAFSRVHYHF